MSSIKLESTPVTSIMSIMIRRWRKWLTLKVVRISMPNSLIKSTMNSSVRKRAEWKERPKKDWEILRNLKRKMNMPNNSKSRRKMNYSRSLPKIKMRRGSTWIMEASWTNALLTLEAITFSPTSTRKRSTSQFNCELKTSTESSWSNPNSKPKTSLPLSKPRPWTPTNFTLRPMPSRLRD